MAKAELKTKYKHIHFEEIDPIGFGEQKAYACRNNKSSLRLGDIFYNSAWSKYVFAAIEEAFFDEICLLDIIDFMKQLK